ncbi:MAG TPA: 16S rRNA (cytosine(1402)-N(4))-methyltransferase RsmH [Thermoleophilaceae bacterium]|nr:16S rRNA (cytosine(1402)-N(4))-methyltransferase RsmH [Thermoleophilaceae bacterium]
MAILVDMTQEHVPVLARELVELLAPRPGDVAVDCTFGAGGHARLVAERIGPGGTLVAVDRDPTAAGRYEDFAREVPCTTRFLGTDYLEALELLAEEELRAELVYLDLGVSSMQLDAFERGFSYAYDAPLDMRMDPRQELDARAVVNEWDERRLTHIFRAYGEERYARQIAGGVARRRRRTPLETTFDLVEAINEAIPAPARFGAGHPARRVFQAIRIAVNDELESLEHALPAAWELLTPGGRLGAISFHSLEDRLVKRFLADRARGCLCPPELPICVCGHEPEAELIASGGVTPSRDEVADNPRARAARLRAGRRLRATSEADG